uniref:3-beta hydroxysteroid dehydrogenase/isomerase domain-containing protein n=1 Tax=Palpitomonas bilix TaxID=652834 RepID=A0A7S3GHW6_9EUKA|mmetsp:Transcript_50053/g.128831  ORF Transcript_50053/g.128831 Transcript_50053/m.128831 type:complete len:258 (+) Transcript_50053:117-890(+)
MVVKGEKCMITGGLGFLGKNLVERLLRRGAHVRVLDLRLPATEIEETFKRLASDFGGKVEFFAGDLTKKDDCLLAVDGMDVIFHCASPSPALQNKKIFYAVNVGGTTNLLEACGEKGITRFVHTSSASVIYEGKSYEYGDEASLPYAANPMDYYTETKILAEKVQLAVKLSWYCPIKQPIPDCVGVQWFEWGDDGCDSSSWSFWPPRSSSCTYISGYLQVWQNEIYYWKWRQSRGLHLHWFGYSVAGLSYLFLLLNR